MEKIIDFLYRFERRLVCPIYGADKDFSFACMDKVSIAEDLGFPSEPSGVVRNVVPHPFRSAAEAASFPWNISLGGENTQNELRAVAGWIKDSAVPQGGGCFGPLTVAACILGIQNCCKMVLKSPELVHTVLRRVTDFMVLLAREEERLGAAFFWIAEPVASLLSPALCARFATPYIREIFTAVNIPGFLHVCGNTDPHFQALLATGAQVLSIDFCTDLSAYLAQAPSDVVIMGNINPMLLWKGTLDEVRGETEALLRKVRNYKNFIMSSGCQVPGSAPHENVQLIIDMARNDRCWTNEQYRLITHLSELYQNQGEAAFRSACSAGNVPEAVAEAARNVADSHLAFSRPAR